MAMIDKVAAPPTPPVPTSRADPAKVENAAKQFESLLIGQIMKSMHEAGSADWMGTGDDPSGESAMELAEEQFAQAMASQGGLGLAKLIVKGITVQQSRNDSQAAARPESGTDPH